MHFRHFLTLLSQNYINCREVKQYATMMSVSPKYLSVVIRDVSGKSASDWVNETIISEAKNLLTHSQMSIGQIAEHLNFIDQSHFGKFFKKHCGVTPSKYK